MSCKIRRQSISNDACFSRNRRVIYQNTCIFILFFCLTVCIASRWAAKFFRPTLWRTCTLFALNVRVADAAHRWVGHCVGANWNVLAHAQKPDLVFRRNGRVHLNRQGTSVQSTTGSRGVRISGRNAGYTMLRDSVKGTGYPLHSPVSPSLPLPCVTGYYHILTGVFFCVHNKVYCERGRRENLLPKFSRGVPIIHETRVGKRWCRLRLSWRWMQRLRHGRFREFQLRPFYALKMWNSRYWSYTTNHTFIKCFISFRFPKSVRPVSV